MCRWIAYCGPPIRLERLLFRAEHSLVAQSRHSQGSLLSVNGDGFGVGWYTEHGTPGLFRDVTPAWHDENLRSLAAHIHSRMFFAHVRASSGSAIQRTNCHPFRHHQWLFQHNGELESYALVRRAIDFHIAPELYPLLRGTTDSERLFYLALSHELEHDPPGALECAAAEIEQIYAEAEVGGGVRLTAAITDGNALHVVRYSSEGDSPSLYVSRNVHALHEVGGHGDEPIPDGAVMVVSEPLDAVSEHWQPVPEGTVLTIWEGQVVSRDFRPRACCAQHSVAGGL